MRGSDYERPPFPATWARRHGRGRVFYSSMGHREDVWANPLFQSILLGGLRWALGMVPADIVPNLAQAAPAARNCRRHPRPPAAAHDAPSAGAGAATAGARTPRALIDAGLPTGANGLRIDLSGRIAVVTGGSGELGRVIVRTLAVCGADVAIHYLRGEDRAQTLHAEVERMGRRAVIVQAEVGDEKAVLRMRDTIGEALGAAPDILVNTAVAQYEWTSVLEQPVQDYESQFRSCVLQNVLMAKAFVPAMIEKNYGRIIALNTECAMQNHPNQSAYVAGKRGMDGVLRVLARDWAAPDNRQSGRAGLDDFRQIPRNRNRAARVV